MSNEVIDEVAIREALAGFARMWDELVPRERARVMRLLVDEARFDGQAGEVTITFRDNGIAALARDAHARRPA